MYLVLKLKVRDIPPPANIWFHEKEHSILITDLCHCFITLPSLKPLQLRKPQLQSKLHQTKGIQIIGA